MTTTIVVQSIEPQVIYTGIMGPPGKDGNATFAGSEEVDLTNLTDGSLLVYNAQTQKWTAAVLLNQQVIDSGQY